jgi:iron complex transport system permease protein
LSVDRLFDYNVFGLDICQHSTLISSYQLHHIGHHGQWQRGLFEDRVGKGTRHMVMRFALLIGCLLMAMIASLMTGVADISFADIAATLAMSASTDGQSGTTDIIILDVRLPRMLLGGLVGACLASTGAAIQGLFRNPLADPALIGVSSGAALMAAFSIVFGSLMGEFTGSWLLVPAAAFIGGLLSTWLVMWLGSSASGTSVSLMLLAGIAINAVTIAGVGLISYLSDASQLRSVTFWALGSFSEADWYSVMLAMTLPCIIILLSRQSSSLNAIVLGESEARHLGVDTQRFKKKIVLYAALGVGISVSLSGVIAFVGLVVPHLIRLMLGSDHKILIPASALLGAILVICADTLSRVIVAPAELPVGIVTSLVGGPFFIYLIIKQKQRLGFTG